MSLPSGYKRLGYIKSSGTQYINTNLSMASGFRAEIDIEFTSLASSILSCVIGAHNDSSPYGRNFLAAQTSLFQIGMGDGYYNFGSPTTGEKYHIDFSNVYGNAYCKINGIGQPLSEAATGTNSYSVNTLYLLAVHGGESWFQKVSGNTYHCKIYSTEGTLVRDYIPCQTTAGEVGMWDDVNEVFYGNAGTGTFTAGPVIAIAIDESEITKLEYIRSSGTQHVDTGFQPNQDTTVEVTFETTQSNQCGVAATDQAWQSNGFGIWANCVAYGSQTDQTVVFYGIGKVTARLDRNKLYKNGELIWTASAATFRCPSNLTLMALNRNGIVQEKTAGNLYSSKIYDNGTIIRDYIAAKMTDGTVGLYDKLHGLLYINVGSGAFTAGPEVPKAPSMPSGFVASSLTDTTVQLNWATVEGATGYNLYKAGNLLATLTDTSYTDTVELFSSTVYAITAYSDDGESEAATLIYHAVPENPILYLVTDRTQADVNAGNDKGTYRASDLNRVGAAMNYVADRLKAQGYDPHISPKTDWKDDDWVDPAAQAVYLGDLAELRKQFTMLASTPEVPPRILATAINSNDGLTYTWANDIEQILMDIDVLLTNIAAGWLYSGEIYSGEV